MIEHNDRPKFRVAIAFPSGDEVKTGFAFDLARLVGYTAASREDVAIYLRNVRDTLLPSGRQELAALALHTDATHILWIDSDMRFPKDALVRLLERDLPIVAANYIKRRLPLTPVAKEYRDGAFADVFTYPETTGLQTVDATGMGFMLVRTDVFRALPLPWFVVTYDKKTHTFGGEDYFFCLHAGHAGFDTVIDHDLSKEIGHLGEFEYKNSHVDAPSDAEPGLVTVVDR